MCTPNQGLTHGPSQLRVVTVRHKTCRARRKCSKGRAQLRLVSKRFKIMAKYWGNLFLVFYT